MSAQNPMPQKAVQSPPASPPFLLTANRLTDGVVLWMDAHGNWTEIRDKAAAFDDANSAMARNRAQADLARQQIIGLYEIHVDGIADQSAREVIRAAKGPSIQPPPDRRNDEASHV